MSLVDDRIADHNKSEQAHDYIQRQIAELPKVTMIELPAMREGKTLVRSGIPYTYTFTAVPIMNSITITKFRVRLADETFTDYPVGDTPNEATCEIAVTGNQGDTTTFTVSAYGTSGTANFNSEALEIPVKISSDPNVNKATFVPQIYSPGTLTDFQVTGIVDADNDFVSFNIECDDPNVVFSKTTDLVQDTVYSVTCPQLANPVVGEDKIITITAYDALGGSSSIQKAIHVSARPDVSNVSLIPSTFGYLSPGGSWSFIVNGAVDNDGDVLTISKMVCSSGAIKFSSTSTNLGSTITITADEDVAEGATYDLTFTFLEIHGATSTWTYHGVVNTRPDVSNATITAIEPKHLAPGKTQQITIEGIVDPEAESMTVDITNGSLISADITHYTVKNNEVSPVITLTASSDCEYNKEYEIPYTVTDASGCVTTSKFIIKTDPQPVVTDLNATLTSNELNKYTIQTPNTVKIGGATHPEGDTLLYSIETDYPNILSFSKTEEIEEDEEITVTVAETAERGQSYTYRVIATDPSGGTNSVLVTAVINKLPTIANYTITVPALVIPGSLCTGTVAGEIDDDGHTLTYTITSETAEVPETVDITSGTSFEFTAPAEEVVARGSKFILDVVISDGLETVTTQVGIGQNVPPDASTVFATWDHFDEVTGLFYGGSEHYATVQFGGGTSFNDPSPDAVMMYHVTSTDNNLYFCKQPETEPDDIVAYVKENATHELDNLTKDDVLWVYAVKPAEDTSYPFEVRILDIGPAEPTGAKELSVDVSVFWVTSQPTITVPAEDDKVSYINPTSASWSEMSVEVDTDMDYDNRAALRHPTTGTHSELAYLVMGGKGAWKPVSDYDSTVYCYPKIEVVDVAGNYTGNEEDTLKLVIEYTAVHTSGSVTVPSSTTYTYANAADVAAAWTGDENAIQKFVVIGNEANTTATSNHTVGVLTAKLYDIASNQLLDEVKVPYSVYALGYPGCGKNTPDGFWNLSKIADTSTMIPELKKA